MTYGYISLIFIAIVLVGMGMPLLKKARPGLRWALVLSFELVLLIYLASLRLIAPAWPLVEATGGLSAKWAIMLYIGPTEQLWLMAILAVHIVHSLLHRHQMARLPLASLLLYFFSLYGIVGIVVSKDLFNLFVMIEIFSISLVGLLLNYDDARHAALSFKYFLVNSLAAAFFLLGVMIIYRGTGLLNVDQVAELALAGGNPAINQAGAFILCALVLKLLLFPLGSWAQELVDHGSPLGLSFVISLMPLLFVYDLQKLFFLFNPAQIGALWLVLLINLLFYLWLSVKEECRGRKAGALLMGLGGLMISLALLMIVWGKGNLLVILCLVISLAKLGLSSLPGYSLCHLNDDKPAFLQKLRNISVGNTVSMMLTILLLFLALSIVA